MNMNIKLVIFYVLSNRLSMLDIFMQNYRICAPFTAIIKYDHSYKIRQCYVGLCKHIILEEQLNREVNKVSFQLLLMKIYQNVIKLHDLL